MSDLFKIIFGILAIGLAWLFVYKTGLIFSINSWVKENIFSDQIILFSRRRMAIMLVILGGVALFSGIDGIVDEQPLKPRIAAEMLDRAQTDFQEQNYRRVIQRCKELVRSNPKNLEAWILLASAWWTEGEKKQAHTAFETIIQLKPSINLDNHPVLRLIKQDK